MRERERKKMKCSCFEHKKLSKAKVLNKLRSPMKDYAKVNNESQPRKQLSTPASFNCI